MSVILVFMAGIAAVVIWWLLPQRLTSKPWLEHGPIEDPGRAAAVPPPTAKIGLWVFLAIVSSLFALFISAYLIRMDLADWIPVPVPKLLWLNTGLLLLSSVAFQRTRNAARVGRIGGVRAGLVAGGFFTFAFLAGQLWAWQQLEAAGYFAGSNPANAFFYLLTALHGLHLLGGLYVWGKTTARAWHDDVQVKDVSLSVELCTVYWHYLLLVWLVLFGLLLST